MANYTGTVIEAQPDWLTVSAHGEDSSQNLLDLALGLEKEERARGNKPRRWRSMGYEGSHVGRIEYGRRDGHSALMRASGDLAADVLQVAASVGDTVPRLDLAVTWQGVESYPDLGRECYAEAERWYHARAGRARPSIVGDADGGTTCYLGNRASPTFFRIYNKEIQERAQLGTDYDGRYDRCWRFELESKDPNAGPLLEAVLAHDQDSAYIQGYIHTFLSQHGIAPPFEQAGSVALVPGFRRASDEDTKLRHLRRNVRPTCDWFRERGRTEVLREALGFDPMADSLRQLQSLLVGWPGTVERCR